MLDCRTGLGRRELRGSVANLAPGFAEEVSSQGLGEILCRILVTASILSPDTHPASARLGMKARAKLSS
jgi:hypothetical protein